MYKDAVPLLAQGQSPAIWTGRREKAEGWRRGSVCDNQPTTKSGLPGPGEAALRPGLAPRAARGAEAAAV